ncbi:MAG: protein kinase domain-containing protein [Myxococcaceae bacterium]
MFGPYELLRSLATGGMGQIYLARSTRAEGFSKLLVVKLLLAEHARDTGFVAMFLDEARIAARLNHPNIGQIFDLGDVAGTYYLAMEYIPGVDLRTLQRDCTDKVRPLPLPLACRIFADAAAGLHYAHELTDDAGGALGVVHRDVSPSNILVSFDGGVKLIDFGIAKAKGRSTATAAGQLKGKFAYMSPEQAEGDELDRRSDLYSLGLVFHEVITGKRVLQRDSDTQTLKAAREGAVEPPSKVNPAVPASLDEVVGRALARRPDDRYPSARDFGLAIEEWLLHSREPASSSHLSGFLKGLYPDHAERSRGPSLTTDDGLGSTVVRTPSGAPLLAQTALTPSSSGKLLAQAPPAESCLLDDPVPPPTQPDRPPRKTRRRLWMIIGLAFGGFWMVGGLVKNRLAPSPPPVEAPAAPRAFKLALTSVPSGATVKLDGMELGKTPLDTNLQAGRKGELTVEGPGLLTRRQALEMNADKQLELQLDRAPVSLTIDSVPPGATVKDGAQVLGVTPFPWKVLPGRRTSLSFDLEGFQHALLDLEPKEGEVVKPVLKRIGKSSSSPFKTKGAR